MKVQEIIWLVEKDLILAEIRRTAQNGVALGRDAFTKATGIRERDWSGKFWARWGDAVREAGLESQVMQSAHAEELVFENLLTLTEKLGRFPTVPEMDLERTFDSSFPSSRSITRRFDRKTLFEKLIAYTAANERWTHLLAELTTAAPKEPVASSQGETQATDYGHVYLIRSDKVYKIGSSRAVYSRTATIVRQAPFGGELVHVISTDDPEGIEHYWHNRFASARISGTNKSSGEWFALSSAEVGAFKRSQNNVDGLATIAHSNSPNSPKAVILSAAQRSRRTPRAIASPIPIASFNP